MKREQEEKEEQTRSFMEQEAARKTWELGKVKKRDRERKILVSSLKTEGCYEVPKVKRGGATEEGKEVKRKKRRLYTLVESSWGEVGSEDGSLINKKREEVPSPPPVGAVREEGLGVYDEVSGEPQTSAPTVGLAERRDELLETASMLGELEGGLHDEVFTEELQHTQAEEGVAKNGDGCLYDDVLGGDGDCDARCVDRSDNELAEGGGVREECASTASLHNQPGFGSLEDGTTENIHAGDERNEHIEDRRDSRSNLNDSVDILTESFNAEEQLDNDGFNLSQSSDTDQFQVPLPPNSDRSDSEDNVDNLVERFKAAFANSEQIKAIVK